MKASKTCLGFSPTRRRLRALAIAAALSIASYTTDLLAQVGPLIAASSAYLVGSKQGDSYRGYLFRILTRQGAHAAGGAYDYLLNGRLIAGFALVAYPATYGKAE